jgi:hypothetical protein
MKALAASEDNRDIYGGIERERTREREEGGERGR